MNIKNPQYVINSLSNQIASLAQEKALRDAIITEQQQEIQELKKQIETLKSEKSKK
jgi:peptidoglycan hydrolase CwlO-like protein